MAKKLQDELKLFRAAMDNACDGIVIADENGDRVYFNGSFSKMFDWPLKQMKEKKRRNIFVDRKQAREMFDTVWAGESWSGEMRACSLKGRQFYVMNHSNAIKDKTGKIMGVFGVYTDITDKKQAEEQLKKACIDLQKMNEELEIRVKERTKELENTIKRLKEEIAKGDRLSQENRYLSQQIRNELHFDSMIGKSSAFEKILDQIKLVAQTNATVLIHGESGTGKELVARAIHESSERVDHPLVKVNCAAIPQELFESEFFGHIKGSFTGAVADRIGRFELADKGTLFLDEIGEIPLALQSKFLRVLQEGQFERMGGTKTHDVNVRIVTATNKNLLSEVERGNFRKDLYYRLSVFPIEVPALRERKEDIIPLAEHFLKVLSKEMFRKCPKVFKGQYHKLKNYAWPGNIRELKNVIERALILSQGNEIHFVLGQESAVFNTGINRSLPNVIEANSKLKIQSLEDLKSLEKSFIIETLEKCSGKIYGSKGAAEYLGIPATTLASKMKKFGITKKWT